MDYSPQRKKELKKYVLDAKEMAYATLVTNGWNKADAYMVCYGESITVSKEYVLGKVSELENNDKLNAYIVEKQNEKKSEKNEDKELIKSLSKEETLKELARARNMYTIGSKEWIDINKQIIDVNNLKKNEVKTDDTTVHYFMPANCEICSLYVAAQKKGEI